VYIGGVGVGAIESCRGVGDGVGVKFGGRVGVSDTGRGVGAVGRGLGGGEGRCEGRGEGFSVVVGIGVGRGLGSSVGFILGSQDGTKLGFAVGLRVGSPVGLLVGACVGGEIMETEFTAEIVIVNPSDSIAETIALVPVARKVAEFATELMVAACSGVRF
jgi:hypothetical protein